MTISTVGVASKDSGSGTSGGVGSGGFFLTLPLGISDGDVGYIVFYSPASDTLDQVQSGWTVTGPLDVGATSRVYFATKTLTAAESGTNVTFGYTTNLKWSAGLVVKSGVGVTETPVSWTDSTVDNQLSPNNVTPSIDGELLLILGGSQYPSGNGTGLTPAAGWTELVDDFTTNVGSTNFGVYIAEKQLGAGTGGNSQSIGNHAYTSGDSNRDSGWVVALRPLVLVAQTPTDNIGITDGSAPRPLTLDGIITEIVALTDNLDVHPFIPVLLSLSAPVGITDSIQPTKFLNLTDNVGITQVFTNLANTFLNTPTDTVGIGNAQVQLMTVQGTEISPIGITDSVDISKPINLTTDNVGITDSVSVLRIVTPTDLINLSDSIVVETALFVGIDLSDLVHIYAKLTRKGGHIASIWTEETTQVTQWTEEGQ